MAGARGHEPAPPDGKHWMTLQAAAAYTSTSEKTIRRQVARGELPAYLYGRRSMRVLREDLDALMRPVMPLR